MPVKKKVLLLGSGGMLGGHFLNQLRKNSIETIAPSRNHINLENYYSLLSFIKKNNVDFLINCISINGIKICSQNKIDAFKVNSLYPHFLSKVCEELDIKLILFSSEMVFPEYKSLPDENSKPNPSTTYGLSKYFGEVLNNKNSIIRLPLLVSLKRNNQIVWKLLDSLKNDCFVRVAYDEYSTPVLAEKVAEKIIYAMSRDILPSGYIHFSSSRRRSLYQTVKDIANFLKIDHSKLLKCSAKDFQTKEPKPFKSGLKASHEFSELDFL